MTDATITPDVHQPFDVHLDFATQIALHLVVRVDDVADGLDVFPGIDVGQVEAGETQLEDAVDLLAFGVGDDGAADLEF